jgi:hypothetical protein
MTPQLELQKELALNLLLWHGGQWSALYSVGSSMLAMAEKGETFDWIKMEITVREAIKELNNLKKNAKYPEAVLPKDELSCNLLACYLEGNLGKE